MQGEILFYGAFRAVIQDLGYAVLERITDIRRVMPLDGIGQRIRHTFYSCFQTGKREITARLTDQRGRQREIS